MRIRVLHITPSLVPYGAERLAANVACGLDPQRFQVGMVSLFADPHSGLAPELRDYGVQIFQLDKRGGFDPRMYGRVTEVLRQVKPHIVHTHNYVMRYTLFPCLREKTPVQVHTLHNLAEHEVDRVGRWLHAWAFRQKVHPVSIAEKVSDSYEVQYHLPRPVMIPNGIAVERFVRAGSIEGRSEWRRKAGISDDRILFLCAARFFEQKNHRMLLNAFAAVARQIPTALLLLAGDGGLQPELEQLTGQLNISDQVRFLGRREDMPEVLAAADVFTLASHWEGNPLSVMEAMAAGLPVVATSVGGVPELVEHGRSGFLAASGDTAGFSQALLEVARDSATLRRMGEAAAQRAREKFDQRDMVRAYDRLYMNLLSAGEQSKDRVGRAA